MLHCLLTRSNDSFTSSSRVEQCNFFLFRDNTILSFFELDGSLITNPICDRLKSDASPLRRTEDTSFLMHALLDGIVDHYFLVTDVYTEQIGEMRSAGTLRSNQLTHNKRLWTRSCAIPRVSLWYCTGNRVTLALYSISRELSAIRRTLNPVKSVVASLHSNEKETSVVISRHTKIYLCTADLRAYLTA